jgi:TonB family protein
MGVRSLRIFRSSLSVSFFLHLLLGLVCFLMLSRQAAVRPRQLTWIEVEPALTSDAMKKIQDALKNKNQIVQTEKGEKTDKAVPNAYLGEQNQTVDRQTVSATHNTTMGKSHDVAKATSETKKAGEKSKQVVQAAPAIGNLGVPILPKAGKPKSDEQVAHEENWADQGSAPQDFVKGVKESDRTALNTKEFIFYGYYQRIRERLDRAWVPILREKLVKYYYSGRHLAAEMDHTTKVVVLLNPRGEITGVKVVSESGTRDLDDAAISAFNQAGPFPNPPSGIIGSSGIIEIPWEFILRT